MGSWGRVSPPPLCSVSPPSFPCTSATTTAPARCPRPARPLRILLAEDSLVNQKLAVGLLEKHGHRVVVANNGNEAIAALAEIDDQRRHRQDGEPEDDATRGKDGAGDQAVCHPPLATEHRLYSAQHLVAEPGERAPEALL